MTLRNLPKRTSAKLDDATDVVEITRKHLGAAVVVLFDEWHLGDGKLLLLVAHKGLEYNERWGRVETVEVGNDVGSI